MITVTITTGEMEFLDRQSPGTSQDGGFQSLLVRLQRNINRTTGELSLSDQDLERIARYAFDYGNGGWEARLVGAFGRTLGPRLGR
jgi:hypothetical protein